MPARRTTFVTRVMTAMLTLLPMTATAQTTPTFSISITESTELIEEVGTTRRIGHADILARNAHTLDEALRLFPGVHVRTGGDGTSRIDVRGFRSRHVLLLVNGVMANSTSDGQFDPSRISTEAIREIKVTYGSSSVLYGDNALAAVIEITTVDDAPDASLHVTGGIPDQKGIGGRYARTTGRWSFTSAVGAYSTNGFQLPASFPPTAAEDGGRRQNSDRNRADARLGVGYRFPTLSIASEWSFAGGSYGVPASTVNDANDIFAQTPRFERVEDYRAASGQVSVNFPSWRRVNLRAWVFTNIQREDRARYDDGTYSSMDDPLVQGTFRSREHTTINGGSALGRIDLNGWGWLRVAVNQRRESFDSMGNVRDVITGGTGGGGAGGGGRDGGSRPATFGVRTFLLDRHVDVYSTGAEWQAHPAKSLGAVVGVALNHQQRPGQTSETVPTWIAGVSYDATAALRLHASATRKIRVPSIDQLFNTASGNPMLRAERAYGLDVGAEYGLRTGTSVGGSAFLTHARDFIERLSGSPFENRERYRFGGAEIVAHTGEILHMDIRGAYSFLDAAGWTSAESRPLQTRPRHRGSIEWTFAPVPRSRLRGAFSWTGAQLYESRGADPVQRPADGYALVDVGFTQRLARLYDVSFDVANLFDRLYDQAYGLPREGRAAILTLRLKTN